MRAMSRPGIRLVCLDIDGTLTDGVLGPPIPGAAEAVRQIRKRVPVRLVTNTTSVPQRVLAEDLKRKGFLDDLRELVTPVTVASRVLRGRGLLCTAAQSIFPEAGRDGHGSRPGRGVSDLRVGTRGGKSGQALAPPLRLRGGRRGRTPRGDRHGGG